MPTTANETKSENGSSSKDTKSCKPHQEQQQQQQQKQQKQQQQQKQKQQQQKQSSKSDMNFFQNELEKVKKNINQYNSSLNPPQQAPFVPYIFNPLKPYTDTRMIEVAIKEPPESQHFPVSRNTALGPCDPWISLDMDLHIPPSTPSTARQSARQDSRQNSSCGEGQGGGEKTNRSAKEKEDTTDLKKDLFPTVKPQPSKFHGETLHYGQVKELRLELKKTYSAEAQRKIDDEYQKTKRYIYSRQLDKMEEYRPISRSNIRATYFAYLQNNPGSKKAVYECVSVKKADKKADSEKADKEKTPERKETDKKSEKADKEQTTESNKTRDSKDGRSKEKELPSEKPTSKNKNDGVRSDNNNNNKNSKNTKEGEQLLYKSDENNSKSEDKGNAKKDSNQKKEQPTKK